MQMLKLLVGCVIAVAAIGFYRNWFSLDSQKSRITSEAVDLRVGLDRAKLKTDVQLVRAKVQQAIEANRPSGKTLQGVVEAVDGDRGTIRLRTDEPAATVTVHMTADSRAWAGDTPIEWKVLQVGDRVTVVYADENGSPRMTALRVTVSPAHF